MTPRYPGAVWMPVGQDLGANNGPVSFSWHEAVTTGSKEAIAGWVNQENSCHGFVAQYGDCAQYKDFDRVAYGVLNGNSKGVCTWETWDDLLPATNRSPDGSHGPNDFPWDAGQCERIADIIAWANHVLGIPIHFMRATNEPGHAPHRLGVPSAGGNVDIGFGPDTWTSHPGKECCGDLRVLQLRDHIIPRAAALAAGMRNGSITTLPTGDVDLATALQRGGGTPLEDTLSAAEVKQINDHIDQAFAALAASKATQYGASRLIDNRYGLTDVVQAVAHKLNAIPPVAKK